MVMRLHYQVNKVRLFNNQIAYESILAVSWLTLRSLTWGYGGRHAWVQR